MLRNLMSIFPKEELVAVHDQLSGEDIFIWSDLWEMLKRSSIFKGESDLEAQGGSSPQARPKHFSLFHYDGQTPPGPMVKRISMEHSDILESMPRPAESDPFMGALRSRWGSCLMDLHL